MKIMEKCLLVMFIAVILGFGYRPFTAAAEALEIQEDQTEVYFVFFDLPDGEATLIKAKNEVMLINTGSPASEESLLNQLNELKIKSLDYLLLTKQSSDYCGNTSRLVERYGISTIFYTGKWSNTCKEQAENTETNQWSAGERHQLMDGLSIDVLHTEDAGEMSLALQFGETSIMYLSNSHIDDEDELLDSGINPEIIKIGDYARGNSPSTYFLSEVDAHLSIIFNSEKGNPNEALMERLNDSWIDVYLLNQVGTTILRLNETDYEVLEAK